MKKTFICKNCKKKERNPSLKGDQEYCGDAPCKRAYKAAWQKKKMGTDREYKKAQRELVKQWRNNKPSHEYQRQYRENHHEYVKQNRDKQRTRNQKRKTQALNEKIVKMDSLTSITSSYYTFTPFKINPNGKIVKMDSLIIILQLLQDNKLD